MVHHPVAPIFRRLLLHGCCVIALLFNLGSTTRATVYLRNEASNCKNTTCMYLPVMFRDSPTPVSVFNMNYGQFRGAFEFSGKLGNVGLLPVYDVRIKMNLYDQSNNLIATDIFTPFFSATLPSQTNYFYGRLGVQLGQVMTKEIIIDSYSLSSPISFISQTVVFSPALSEYPDETTGYIYNTQAMTISNIKVAVQTNCGRQIDSITNTIKPGGFITYTHSRCFYDYSYLPPQELLGAQAQLLP